MKIRSVHCFAAALQLLIGAHCLAGGVIDIKIVGDAADFEAQRQSLVGSSTTLAEAGEADSLRVFGDEFIPNVALDEGRPVFQFNLADIGAAAADNPLVQSAALRLTLLSVSPDPEFGVEAWGRGENLDAPVFYTDGGASAHYGSAAYARVHDAGFTWVPETAAEPTEVSLDVTTFLNARYSEFLDTGSAWVFFRLQADQSIALGDGAETTFAFASADHPDPDLRPELELTLIPEPRLIGLAAGFLALTLVLRRRRNA